MTAIDEAVADAGRQLDSLLNERQHDLALQLISEGVDPCDGQIEAVLERQHAVDLAWRDGVLSTLRAALRAGRVR